LSDGQKHPLARVSQLVFPCPTSILLSRTYHIRISGDHVGILIRVLDFVDDDSDDRSFTVQNWKTGNILLTVEDWLIHSFTFIDASRLVAGRVVPNEDPQDDDAVVITVIDFSKGNTPRYEGASKAIPHEHISFHLPPINHQWEIWHLDVTCDPPPTWDSSHTSQSPFRMSQLDRVVAVRMNGLNRFYEADECHDMFIPVSSLIGQFEKTSENGAFLSWDSWGPCSTRILPSVAPSCVWCYPTYGTKYVGQERGHVVIYDFNPLAIRCAANEDGVQVVTRSIDKGSQLGLFSGLVPTSLPYRKFKTTIPVHRGDSLMISEDSVVIVQEQANNFRIVSV